MYYTAIKNLDVANGPGIRVSLFVSGCRNRCKGCFQPETWDFKHGKPFTTATMVRLLELLRNEHVSGLSVLGGDPMEPENADVVCGICKTVKEALPEKSIWMWTGYLWEDIKGCNTLNYVDVVVDGPFVEAEKNLCLPYCGSYNQRVIDVKKSFEYNTIAYLGGTMFVNGKVVDDLEISDYDFMADI